MVTAVHVPIGGTLLRRIADFVILCRTCDPAGEYPHVGDIRWWFRLRGLDDPANWFLHENSDGQLLAFCLTNGTQIICVLHPHVHTPDLVAMLHSWAQQRIVSLMQHPLADDPFTISEDVADDDHTTIAYLEHNGFQRQTWHYMRYQRPLTQTLPLPQLPAGFRLRSLDGVTEVAARAALHRAAFSPFTVTTDTAAVSLYQRVMQTPGYTDDLDLVAIGPDGTFAASCLGWMDTVNQIGLFEPVGTHPAFRRRGLATALLREGLRRFQERGAIAALISAKHPSSGTADLPDAFFAARSVYEQIGFAPVRKIWRYYKEYRKGST